MRRSTCPVNSSVYLRAEDIVFHNECKRKLNAITAFLRTLKLMEELHESLPNLTKV